jgi:transposase InsO family protein
MSKAEKKVVNHKLSVLKLAEILGNVSEACRRRNVDRTSFYEYKRRFQTHGLEGLKDLPPVHHYHPQTTPVKTVEKILNLSLQHPAYGCGRLSDLLKLEQINISKVTIQNILNKHNLRTMYDRLLKLEEKNLNEKLELTAEQLRYLERTNPCWRERHIESGSPGELLSQDTFYVGRIKGVGQVYLQVVIDTYGSYAFGYLHTTRMAEHSAAIVHNEVLPQYRDWGIKVKAMLTDNGTEYCGTDSHPYELYLALNEIEHRRTKVKSPRTNGFVERFNRTALNEFFRIAFRKKFYESVESLQEDFDKWLKHYNTERPHQGYRNMGKRPLETIKEFVCKKKKENVNFVSVED